MSDDGPGTREVAHRVFAAEFDDASLSYSESDEERAPNYVVTPTGARVNRLFVAGVLTEVERVNDQTSRGRVVDPSGAFVTYAGQYQPDEQAFLERAETPAFVALTGKARTFEPEDSDRVFTSVRPESLSEVDAEVRDRWVVSAAEATLDRLAVLERALASDLRGEELRGALEAGGAAAALAAGIPRALAHYDTSPAYVEAVRRMAVDALEMIAGERDEVRGPDVAPDAGDDATIGPLPDTDVRIEAAVTAGTARGPPDQPETGATESAEEATGTGTATEAANEPAGTTTGTGAADPSETDAASTTADAPDDALTATETAVTAADEAADEGGPDAGLDDGLGTLDDPDDPGDTDGLGDPDDPGDLGDGTGLGDFDDGGTDVADGVGTEADADELYELDEEEREEIESEFGTDFSTGSEVDEPGEADIDVPGPEEPSEDVETGDAAGGAGSEASGAESASVATAAGDEESVGGTTEDESEADPADVDTSEADPADVDLEAAAIAEMEALDDGDGADRGAVVEAVAAEHGVDPEAVEDAVQDALMGGKCYEPGDGLLKAI
jgi:RPA family protein